MAFWRARLSAASKSTGSGSLRGAGFDPRCSRSHSSQQRGDARGAPSNLLSDDQDQPRIRNGGEDAMRAVIVTLLRPPDPARDRHGVYRRLRTFLTGVSRVCEEIEIVHFARPEETALVERMRAESSEFWGTPVSVRLAPLNLKARLWWQAASVPLSLRHR